MKNKFIKWPLLGLAGLLMLTLSSCFKDKYAVDYVDNTDRTIVEFADGANEINAINLDFSATAVNVSNIKIRVVPRSKPLSKDITVRLVLQPALIADYNTANGTSYTPLPAPAYTITTLDVVIPKDAREVSLPLSVLPPALLSGSYALGLSIASVSDGEISELAKNGLYSISVKNKYDGVYEVTGQVTDMGGVYTETFYPKNIELRTIGTNEVDYYDQDYGVLGMIVESSSAAAYLIRPRFVFDLNTDKLTGVKNNTTNVLYTTVAIDPAINQFTFPAGSKKWVIKYVVSGRFTVTETWNYVGPR